MKKQTEYNDSAKAAYNGIKYLCSDEERAKKIIDKYPDIISNLSLKSQFFKVAYMNVLIQLIDTMCLSLHDITEGKLNEADNLIADLVDAGFKLDWLKKKPEEIRVKKKKWLSRRVRMRELCGKIEKQSQVLLTLETELKNLEDESLAEEAPLTFSDLV